jgi:hypothetical protein
VDRGVGSHEMYTLGCVSHSAHLLLICASYSGSDADGKGRARSVISLSLAAVEKTIKRGTVPRFRLTIRNCGQDSQRVLDLRGGRRPDLHDTYCKLVVTEGDKAVDLPSAISDPGAISDNDFFDLKPGEAVTMDLSRFATMLERLPPGRYKARVRFWQDPYQSSKTSISSPAAEFVVRK